jgi:hypothetical protein
LCALLTQQCGHFGFSVVDREFDRGGAVVAFGVHVGASVEQQPDDVNQSAGEIRLQGFDIREFYSQLWNVSCLCSSG